MSSSDFFLQLLGADLRRRRRAELIAAIERERLDAIPVRREESGRDRTALRRLRTGSAASGPDR